jgi:hypothetical protein
MFKKILVAAFLVLVVVSTSQAYDVMEAKGQWIEAGPGYGIVLNEKIDLLMVQKPYGREFCEGYAVDAHLLRGRWLSYC